MKTLAETMSEMENILFSICRSKEININLNKNCAMYLKKKIFERSKKEVKKNISRQGLTVVEKVSTVLVLSTWYSQYES